VPHGPCRPVLGSCRWPAFANALDGVAVRTSGFFDFFDRDFRSDFGKLRYLARKRRQGRTQSLLLFDLCGKVVLLLDHRPVEKHEPVFPVLLSFADGLLRATQRQIIAVLVSLDHALHRAVGNAPVPGAQQ